jgi:hypothetical protein
MTGLGLRDAARRLGISHVGLKKAADVGRAPRNPDGTFDLATVRASEWWRSREDQAPAVAPSQTAARPSNAPTITSADSRPKSPLERLQELSKVDIEKLVLAEKKEKLRLGNEREKNNLIDRATVEAAWTEYGVRFRDAVLGLTHAVVNRLPAEWRREVLTVLDEEARRVLAALSDEIRNPKTA